MRHAERSTPGLWGRVRRWWADIGTPVADLDDHPTTLVDANTRTFWARGADAPETLVETSLALRGTPRRRVSSLLERHERGVTAEPSARPRANPAFSEGVFVELMRARQYDRAFTLLAPDCRRLWRTASVFAAAQQTGALRHLQGATVKAVEHIENWQDPDSGIVYGHVARLDVDYVLDNGRRHLVVPRTVHLVAVDGRWMSLCYPEGAEAASR